jgi:hypothetical protein
MKALDKTRDYAQIVGDSSGRAFEQDGRFFTANGQPWTAPAEAPAEAPEAAAETPSRARRIRPTTADLTTPPSGADEQIAAQLGT